MMRTMNTPPREHPHRMAPRVLKSGSRPGKLLSHSAPWRVLLLGGLCCAAPFPEARAGVTIAKGGEPRAAIVVAADASMRERHAAAELVAFLEQITGGAFETLPQPKADTANVCVGRGAAKGVDPAFSTEGLGADGLVIKTVGKDLVLAGGEPRGTLYAVYTFLEDELGCRWWTPQASRIPKRPDLAVGNLDRRYVPQFEHRDIMIMPYTRDPDWVVRNKCVGELTGYGQFDIMPERGGCRKAWPCGHSYYTVLPPEKYFGDHPEWYSLLEGKRTAEPKTHSSLCLSNEEMQSAFLASFKEQIRGAPALFVAGGKQYAGYFEKEENPLMFVSVSPEDDAGYPFRCQCEPCREVDEAEGSPAGAALRLANRAAEAIRPEFPDKTVYIYAYHHTQKPPAVTRPDSSMVVYFCPINASFSRPLTDPRNKRWHDDLMGWLKICRRVYVYDYPDNVTYQLTPHPNLRALAENIRIFADRGVTGYHGDGVAGGSGGTEMAELRAWLVAKLLWDPYQDPEALIEDFTDGYYGPAGRHIRGYLDVIHDAVEISGDWLSLSSPPDAQFLSLEAMVEGWARLQAAEDTVADDPALLPRVKVAQLPALFVFLARWDELKYTALSRGVEWPLAAERREAHEDFMNVVESNGITPDPRTLKMLNGS